MRIRNTQYAASVNARLCTDAQYAIRNTQLHSNGLFSGCSQQVLCVSSAHTQYAIRNAQSCSRQDCVNTQQGASVRRQSIRSVNRMAHVSDTRVETKRSRRRARPGGRACDRSMGQETRHGCQSNMIRRREEACASSASCTTHAGPLHSYTLREASPSP